MAIELLNALGAGSGLDSKAIVDALVAAERAPQESRITKKSPSPKLRFRPTVR